MTQQGTKGMVVYGTSALLALGAAYIIGKALWEGKDTQEVKMKAPQIALVAVLLWSSFAIPYIGGIKSTKAIS